MLESKELAERLKRCADGQVSIGDFEEWFGLTSWNVHQQQDNNLTEAVFRIEELFSLLNDGRIETPELLRQFGDIAASIRTLAQPNRYRLLAEAVAWQFSNPSEYTLRINSRVGLLAPEENAPLVVMFPDVQEMDAHTQFASASS
jgi:hypothetical protein